MQPLLPQSWREGASRLSSVAVPRGSPGAQPHHWLVPSGCLQPPPALFLSDQDFPALPLAPLPNLSSALMHLSSPPCSSWTTRPPSGTSSQAPQQHSDETSISSLCPLGPEASAQPGPSTLASLSPKHFPRLCASAGRPSHSGAHCLLPALLPSPPSTHNLPTLPGTLILCVRLMPCYSGEAFPAGCGHHSCTTPQGLPSGTYPTAVVHLLSTCPARPSALCIPNPCPACSPSKPAPCHHLPCRETSEFTE